MKGDKFYRILIDSVGKPRIEEVVSVGTGTANSVMHEVMALREGEWTDLKMVRHGGDGIPAGYFRTAARARELHLQELRSQSTLLAQRIRDAEELLR